MQLANTPSLLPWSASLKWAGLLLGMSMGGVFDGIVLHQILQWHHLLNAVEGQPWPDLRMQLVVDGAFHALMYAVLAAGPVLVCKARQDLALGKADRCLFASMLVGFGLWNALDGIIFHWVMALPHIKMDAVRPFLWDLAWFVALGVLPLAIGYRLRRAAECPGGPVSRHSKAVAASLALLIGGAGWQPLRPSALAMMRDGLSARRGIGPGLQGNRPDQRQGSVR